MHNVKATATMCMASSSFLGIFHSFALALPLGTSPSFFKYRSHLFFSVQQKMYKFLFLFISYFLHAGNGKSS